MIINTRIIDPGKRPSPLLLKQIQALEAGEDLSQVFEPGEIQLIESIGRGEYLKCLIDIKTSTADGGSEE